LTEQQTLLTAADMLERFIELLNKEAKILGLDIDWNTPFGINAAEVIAELRKVAAA
jgi:hypothetical protein